MTVRFAAALLLSALLLFAVQPMFGKMVLPLFGGAPAVWTTCLLFFQATLLAGYAYAHGLTARLSWRWQICLHGVLMAAALSVLPIRIPELQTLSPESPIGSLLWLMVTGIGLPFFVLSSTAPLLQRWFSATRHRFAKDPYFLYAASNTGSLLGLFGYLLLIEPHIAVPAQSRLWTAGFALLALLLLTCATSVRTAAPAALDSQRTGTPNRSQLLRWELLAFAPSSLMLGVTTHISTDIAPVPMFWVLPLALYLLSFVLVFAKNNIVPEKFLHRFFPMAVLPLSTTMVLGATSPLAMLLPLHLLTFFVIAILCHGALAKDRPDPQHMTRYYLVLSMGGACGGLFNAVIAPGIFPMALEYPIALVFACALIQREGTNSTRFHLGDLGMPVLLAIGVVLATWGLGLNRSAVDPSIVFVSGFVALPSLWIYSFRDRPLRFAAGVAAFLLAGMLAAMPWREILYIKRTFFGIHQVEVLAGQFHALKHSNTYHGFQSLQPSSRCEPIGYYRPNGPLRAIFDTFATTTAPRRVAIVGLGTGGMIAYSRPGEHWTFYEIDPAVAQIASDKRFFTYLSNCAAGAESEIVLGDARLSLQRAEPGTYGLLAVDAFSSDAIPVHLLTREAIRVYQSRLAPHGLLAFHVSNRYLNLAPVVSAIAAAENLHAYVGTVGGQELDLTTLQLPSTWIVLARDLSDAAPLLNNPHWKPLEKTTRRPWTDTHSNILQILRSH